MSHSAPISRRDSKGQARAAAAAVVVAPDPVFAVYPGAAICATAAATVPEGRFRVAEPFLAARITRTS